MAQQNFHAENTVQKELTYIQKVWQTVAVVALLVVMI